MARKTEEVIIPQGNRDAGKVFLLTEMSAARAEKWAARLLIALAAQQLIAPGDARMGMAGLAGVSTEMIGALSFDVVEPLMDEMMECVTIIRDPKAARNALGEPQSYQLLEDDIEEVSTRITLRGRLIDLHTGFSVSGFLARMGAEAKSRLSNIPTSPEPSEASSEPA